MNEARIVIAARAARDPFGALALSARSARDDSVSAAKRRRVAALPLLPAAVQFTQRNDLAGQT